MSDRPDCPFPTPHGLQLGADQAMRMGRRRIALALLLGQRPQVSAGEAHLVALLQDRRDDDRASACPMVSTASRQASGEIPSIARTSSAAFRNSASLAYET